MSDTDEWECPNCGASDPHHAITFPSDEQFEDEVEVDVTCGNVYITPVFGSNGFAFTHSEFEEIIEHYRSADTQ